MASDPSLDEELVTHVVEGHVVRDSHALSSATNTTLACRWQHRWFVRPHIYLERTTLLASDDRPTEVSITR
jgi:hypothetical protein